MRAMQREKGRALPRVGVPDLFATWFMAPLTSEFTTSRKRCKTPSLGGGRAPLGDCKQSPAGQRRPVLAARAGIIDRQFP